METSVRVGQELEVGDWKLVVESIMRREFTRKVYFDHKEAEIEAKRICTELRSFQTDEFEKGDIVTERLEEIRLRELDSNSPLVIHNYHTYTKEQQENDTET